MHTDTEKRAQINRATDQTPTQIQAHIDAYLDTSIYTERNTHVHTNIDTDTNTHIHTRRHMHTYRHSHTYKYIDIHTSTTEHISRGRLSETQKQSYRSTSRKHTNGCVKHTYSQINTSTQIHKHKDTGPHVHTKAHNTQQRLYKRTHKHSDTHTLTNILIQKDTQTHTYRHRHTQTHI